MYRVFHVCKPETCFAGFCSWHFFFFFFYAADIFDSVSCEGGTRGDIASERKGKKEKKNVSIDNTKKKTKLKLTLKFCNIYERNRPPVWDEIRLSQSGCIERAQRKQREPIKQKQLNGVIHQAGGRGWLIARGVIGTSSSESPHVYFFETRPAASLDTWRVFARGPSRGMVITIYGLFILSLRIRDWSTCKIGNSTVAAPNHSALGGEITCPVQAEGCQPDMSGTPRILYSMCSRRSPRPHLI